jgi:hypothetical protein
MKPIADLKHKRQIMAVLIMKGRVWALIMKRRVWGFDLEKKSMGFDH